MIVVDTNVIAYLFIDGDFSENARRLFLKDPDWIAPILWRSEFRNVLALYIRKGNLDLEDAVLIMNEAVYLMSGREYEVQSERVLKAVSESNCSAYDCEFVVLAQDFNLKLYTSDKMIFREFSETVHLISEI